MSDSPGGTSCDDDEILGFQSGNADGASGFRDICERFLAAPSFFSKQSAFSTKRRLRLFFSQQSAFSTETRRR